MLILIVASLLIALASLGVSLRLAVRIRELENRVHRPLRFDEPAPPELPAPSPLQGLRVSIGIDQDHPHAVFANLLREQLLREDCTDVLLEPSPDVDLRISGRIVCNGYAEFYYEADLVADAPNATLVRLLERPPGGGRQENLALELVAKLSKTFEEWSARDERRQALRELRSDL